MPERVWEQSFARDLVDAGIEYTVLDDFHFKCAGLTESQLTGHLLTEDEGRVLSVFPGSERLRYMIPFADPQQTIDYLAKMAEEHPNAVVVFGDDGEKFGTWPETKKHVYDDGWLARFFDALVQNQDWIQVTTLAEAFDNVPPVGKIYLPDCSYREMTEWALPAEQLVRVRADRARDAATIRVGRRCGRSCAAASGGTSSVKYPEADEMYCRMMMVSRRLQETLDAAAAGEPVNAELVEQARTELYRGQCNCGYWHGAFGGIYLPHLRNAVYQHLIAADNLLDRAIGRPETWIEAAADDFNFDARQEVRLTNDKLMALVAPSRGGQMIELDVRRIQHNLLATLARRPEAYHRKVLAGEHQQRRPGGQHPRARGVQAARPRQAAAIRRPRPQEPDGPVLRQRRDAGGGGRRARRRSGATSSAASTKPASAAIPTASRCNCSATAPPCGVPLRITKGLTLDAGSSTLASRLSAGEPAAGPAAAFRRRVELRRPAGQRLRPELLATSTASCSASSARSSI